MKLSESTDILVIASMLEAIAHRNIDLAAIFSAQGMAQVYRDICCGSSVRCETSLRNETSTSQRISLDDYGRLLRAIWQAMDDEASGYLSRPFKVGTFRMMCHALITAGNLRRALLRSARFIALMTDDITLHLEEKGDEARFYIRYRNPHGFDQTFFITSLYVIWLRLSSWLIDRPILPERMHFAFPAPVFRDEYPMMFPCRLAFDQPEHVLVFKRDLLAQGIRQDVESLSVFLEGAPISLLTWSRSDRSITAKVKRRLLTREGMHTRLDIPGFEQLAESMELSTHTLRRRLKEEGHSFQEIKDNLRRGRAIQLLQSSNVSIADIAEDLGFSEPAAFTRAFKKWTGLPPAEFRAYADAVAEHS